MCSRTCSFCAAFTTAIAAGGAVIGDGGLCRWRCQVAHAPAVLGTVFLASQCSSFCVSCGGWLLLVVDLLVVLGLSVRRHSSGMRPRPRAAAVWCIRLAPGLARLASQMRRGILARIVSEPGFGFDLIPPLPSHVAEEAGLRRWAAPDNKRRRWRAAASGASTAGALYSVSGAGRPLWWAAPAPALARGVAAAPLALPLRLLLQPGL
jgi:hypothetical protein